MTAAPAPSVRPAVALVFCLIGFFALVVAGLGLASLVTDADVIAVHGLGQLPGATGVAAACAAFAGALWGALRRAQPSFWAVLGVVAAAYLFYVLVTAIAAAIAAADMGAGLAVADELATGWQGVIVAGAALVASWAGIALVRTRAHRPRWPWEHDGAE